MINNVTLVGRLTKDVEFKTTQGGISIARFNLAVNRNFKNKQGEQEADFINCIAFRKLAENVDSFIGKGSLVGIDGRIQSGSYENQEGKRVFTTEVVCNNVAFLDSKKGNDQNTGSNQQSGANPFDNTGADVNPEDLPF